MRVKALWLPLLVLSLSAAASDGVDPGYAPQLWDTVSWRMHLRSTGYAFETVNAQDRSLQHFGFYQHFDGSVANLLRGHVSFRMAGRFADDLNVKPRLTDRERLYVGYAQYAQNQWALRARAGRQFIQEGPNSLTLDGAWMKLSPVHPVELSVFAGARAPESRTYEFEAIEQETAVGVRTLFRPSSKVQGAVSYGYFERDSMIAAKPVGFELRGAPKQGVRAFARAVYETQSEDWTRAEFSAQWRQRRDWPTLSIHLLDRQPSIAADSWLRQFDVERIQIARASAQMTTQRGFGAELEVFGANVDTRESGRVAGRLLFPVGSVGYSARIGDSGEESTWIGNLGYAPLSWLKVAAGATLSTYALMEDANSEDERDLITAYGRLRAQLNTGICLTAEVQSVDSPFYSEDFRLLLGLDLVLTSAESSYGISREGWLP